MMEVVQIDSNHLDRYCDFRLAVEFRTRAVTLESEPVTLTNVEYRLLAILAQNAGYIVPRATLLMRVWGYSPEIRTRTLDVHIRRLRTKLRDDTRQHIETIFGVGYRLQPWAERQYYQAVSA